MTMNEDKSTAAGKGISNRVILGVCVAFFCGMIGVSYAAVPLYRVFCQVTGYGGTTQRTTQYADRVLDQDVTIRFDTNTAGIPWTFEPVKRSMTIKIGETAQAHFTATNTADKPVTGRATFNVTPDIAGSYFNKVECFCFTDTTLQPGETLDMPVVFYVDPDIVNEAQAKNIKTITLSYTMFPEEEKPVASAPAKDQDGKAISGTQESFGG
ncbi:MAG: cytochrome c oxidase assembly protein [Mesorhizobium sp.]